MKLTVDDIKFNIILNETDLNANKTPVVFLHGFTGCAKDWLFLFDRIPLNFFPIAIDLIGHGETGTIDNLDYYSSNGIVHHLDSIFSKLNLGKIIIAGYSMGGRAALSFSVQYPQRIKSAILESSSPGIEDLLLKKQRVEFDLLLADKIKEIGTESFINLWFDTPLFEPLKKLPNFESIRTERYQNNPVGLANMLSGFSTGIMTDYWGKLHLFDFPVLLITGDLDEKFTNINRKMLSRIPKAQHQTVMNCGHNVHLEKPEVFIKLVNDFLNNSIE
jgi:2-succinyl-6-hydroxy-2,4-cyclohexadiene-1-carboxylate synthase